MRNQMLSIAALTGFLVAVGGTARADVCLTIDKSRDTLLPLEQTAAIILLTNQFEREGQAVVPPGCPRSYSVSHVRLGDTIVVTLIGPTDRREATARGMDDLPALYSQIVRSILTGRPMSGFNVVDRTNVMRSQETVRRMHSDSLWYARVGYGTLFGGISYGTPSLGFGYRAEFDKFGVDVAFLNFQLPSSDAYSAPNASAQSLLKISGLYFLSPTANRTAYFGGGIGYGHQSFGGGYRSSTAAYTTAWDGSGLQAELTTGYEFARVTSLRVFLQLDAILPLYQATAVSYSRTGYLTTTDRRYAPSLAVSIGVGR